MPRSSKSSAITNTKSSKKSANNSTGLLKLECENCGGQIELNLDDLIASCPYCGKKLMIDTTQLGKIITEREKTKRHKMDLEHKENKKKLEMKERQHSVLIALEIVLILVGGVLLLVIPILLLLFRQ